MNGRKEEEYAGSSAISVLCQKQPYSWGFGKREGRQGREPCMLFEDLKRSVLTLFGDGLQDLMLTARSHIVYT